MGLALAKKKEADNHRDVDLYYFDIEEAASMLKVDVKHLLFLIGQNYIKATIKISPAQFERVRERQRLTQNILK